MTRTPDDKPSALPRGEIENLCLLSAIPAEGCALGELSVRLGLSPLLAEPIAEAVMELKIAGWVQEADGRISATVTGRAWLKEQLADVP